MQHGANGMRAALDLMAEIGRKAAPHSEKDYRDEDGLLYCGNCKTRKEFRLVLMKANPANEDSSDQTVIVPVACKCHRENEEAAERERKSREAITLLDKLKKASMMDARLQEAIFEKAEITSDNKRSLTICRRYVEKFDEMYQRNQGLLFMGGIGTGKTYAAACIANALLAKMVPCVMTSFVRLVNMINPFDDETDVLLEQLMQVKLLVIDDLGAQRETSTAIERVYDIIDRRYQANRPMIITTNLTPGELADRKDIRTGRVYDRILECCTPIFFAGESWRIAEATSRMDKLMDELGVGNGQE